MVILIADDDRLARFQLKSLLCELDAETLIIHEAANGKRLVEECRLHRPDVAFVDIEMPQMDGLSAIEECRRICADTQFVIISAHSDFGFARRGIALQVADYLLKPIESEQLEHLLAKLRQQLAHTRRGINTDFGVRAAQCLQLWEEIGRCEAADPCQGRSGCYFGYRFYIDCAPGGTAYGSAYLKLTEALQGLSTELAGQRVRSLIWEPKQAGLDFIIFCAAPPVQISARLEALCRRLSGSGLCVTCLCAQGATLWALYTQMNAGDEQQALRFGAAGELRALDELHFPSAALELFHAADELAASFHEADGLRYEKALATLKGASSGAAAIDAARFTRLLGTCLGAELVWDGQFGALAAQLMAHKARIYKAGGGPGDKMDRVVDYVERHYMEDISVVYLAERLGMTPNYFSTVFHERMGQTFSAYITGVRIEHAKQILLSRPDVRVREVAVMVGYYSPRHFSGVFKKLTGCFPSEFRESAGGQERA